MSNPGFFDVLGGLFEVLLNPVTAVVLILLFIVALILLIALRKKLSFTHKLVLSIFVVFVLLYLAFLVCLSILFAGHSTAADPVRN